MFSEDLQLEIEAINSIYGPETLTCIDGGRGDFVLSPPDSRIGMRLRFPQQYPEDPPTIEGSETLNEATARGHTTHVLQAARTALHDVYEPGNVCIYNLIEALPSALSEQEEESLSPSHDASADASQPGTELALSDASGCMNLEWARSEVIKQMKSTFLSFATRLESSSMATRAIESLLAENKKLAKATHNISAYRMSGTDSGFDDDGEHGAGSGIANLLETMNMVNCLVVVSRWYGGIKLGPDRFRLINRVARQAIVNLQEQEARHPPN